MPFPFCNLLEVKELIERGGKEDFGIPHADLLKSGRVRRSSMFDALLILAPSARWQIPTKSRFDPHEPLVAVAEAKCADRKLSKRRWNGSRTDSGIMKRDVRESKTPHGAEQEVRC